MSAPVYSEADAIPTDHRCSRCLAACDVIAQAPFTGEAVCVDCLQREMEARAGREPGG